MNVNIEMEGWKTWIAVGCFLASAITAEFGLHELSSKLYDIAVMFGLVGIGAKLDKTRRALVK